MPSPKPAESTSGQSQPEWLGTIKVIAVAADYRKVGLQREFVSIIYTIYENPSHRKECKHRHKTYAAAKACMTRMLEREKGKLTKVQKQDAEGQRELFQ